MQSVTHINIGTALTVTHIGVLAAALAKLLGQLTIRKARR